MARKTAKRRLRYHLDVLKVKEGDIVVQKINREKEPLDVAYQSYKSLENLMKNMGCKATLFPSVSEVSLQVMTIEELVVFRDRLDKFIANQKLIHKSN